MFIFSVILFQLPCLNYQVRIVVKLPILKKLVIISCIYYIIIYPPVQFHLTHLNYQLCIVFNMWHQYKFIVTLPYTDVIITFPLSPISVIISELSITNLS